METLQREQVLLGLGLLQAKQPTSSCSNLIRCSSRSLWKSKLKGRCCGCGCGGILRNLSNTSCQLLSLRLSYWYACEDVKVQVCYTSKNVSSSSPRYVLVHHADAIDAVLLPFDFMYRTREAKSRLAYSCSEWAREDSKGR